MRSTEPLSLRIVQVLRNSGQPMMGHAITLQLEETPQAVIHMLGRLYTLNVVAKKRQGDRYAYTLGKNQVKDYELGALINGTAKRIGLDGPKIDRGGTITWSDMVLRLPKPDTVLARLYFTLCELAIRRRDEIEGS